MKSFLIIAAFSVSASAIQAQCVNGDCKNGKGKFNFGWCVYEGDFKNEKPEGMGIMKYDDYTYEGAFKNGVEDGKGVITYKDGRKEEVLYNAGKKENYKPVVLQPGAYKALEGHDPNCTNGKCSTGYGTYVFPSGNIYTGNFNNYKREGHGTFYYVTGNMFEGEWHDNQMVEGTFTYATGAQYKGTYDAAGNELNGTVIAGSRRVPIVNGKAVIVKQELYGYKTAAEIQRDQRMKEWSKKPSVIYTKWGFEKSAIEKDKEAFEKMMHESDARDRAYDRKWGNY